MLTRRPTTLLARVTCPNCWHKFDPADVLWISTSPSLVGDPILGPDAPKRFLPTRFSVRGNALDENSSECSQLACPKCHLGIPRVCLELKPWFVSVLGAPNSGKSYFLAAMIHQLRRRLPGLFTISFTDSDALINQILVGYEQKVFSNSQASSYQPLSSLIFKTHETGDLYNSVEIDGGTKLLPKPFLFTIRPLQAHALSALPPLKSSRVLCLYDNAGESFLAGKDTTNRPVTRHLAESSLLLFLFDPTQAHGFRHFLTSKGIEIATDDRHLATGTRQDLILVEAATRVRRFANLPDTSLHARPLFVLVSKQDIWFSSVFNFNPYANVIAKNAAGQYVLDLGILKKFSSQLRAFLKTVAPEIVNAAETFCNQVFYLSVSALGIRPRQLTTGGAWMVRPDEITPVNVDIPILFGLSQIVRGSILCKDLVSSVSSEIDEHGA